MMSPQDWALSVFGRVPTNLIRCDHPKPETFLLRGFDGPPNTYITWCPGCQLSMRAGIRTILLAPQSPVKGPGLFVGLHDLLRASGSRYRQPMPEDPLLAMDPLTT